MNYDQDYLIRDDYETGDNYMYPNQEYLEQEYEDLNEIGAYERMAFFGDEVQDINAGIAAFTEKNRHITNTAESFRIRMDAISRSLTSNEILNITQNDINYMSDYIKKISHPEFINPTGYILGYYITSGGSVSINSLNKKKLDEIFKKIKSEIKTGNIKEPDVIRYCKFWIKIRNS
jgi:hypothetical protein